MHAGAWKARMTSNYRHIDSAMRGVSLLEMLIAMAILGIIVSVAVPSMSEFGANQRLIGAAEQVYGHVQQARSESVGRNVPVYVNFSADSTTTWTYGMGLATGCTVATTNPTTAGACILTVDSGDGDLVDDADKVLMRFPSTDFEDVKMGIVFAGGVTQISYDPIRGTATPASAQINLESSGGKRLRVTVSLLGRSELCSPDGSVSGYGTC
jgi:type IV fimbrial biogenesis protein FimT